MRNSLAAIRLLIGTAIRVDPRRAVLVLVLSPLLNVVAAGQAIGLQLMIDGAATRDLALGLSGGLLLAVVTVSGHQFGAIATDLRMVLQQRVGLEFDRGLMRVCSGPVHVGHYQDPEFLDAAELVRQRRGDFGTALAAFVENAKQLAWFVVAVALLVAASPLLALLPLFVVPLALAIRWQTSLVSAAELAGAEADRRRLDLFTLATDAVPAREVRLYRLSGEIAARHKAAFLASSRPREAARMKGAVVVALGWLLFSFAFIGGLFVVARAVVNGTQSPGEAVLVILLGTRLVSATTGISWLLGWLGRTLDTVGLYMKLAAHPAGKRPSTAPEPLPERGDLVLEDVSFRYPGQPEPALGPVDLRLPAGSTVAIVGDNGAGKSTLVSLLAGLQPVSAGRITFGGQDLAGVRPESWHSRVTACFQDFCRFELTAREAVGFGNLKSIEDTAAVNTALAAADAADVVAGLPAGLDTQLGRTFPEGTDLSAGQWQKLALARARMRTTPTLVLLDEPAASLDPDSEAALLRRYLAARGQCDEITVIVSHRFSTVRTVDLIVVLDQGKIIEVGSHTELMDRDGHYANMYALHAAAYAPSPAAGQVTA